MDERTEDEPAPERTPPPWDLGVDDLSGRSSDQLDALQRARRARLRGAAAALMAGLLLAALPFGWALAVPATVMLVGGLFAVPVAGYLLVSVKLEIARRGSGASGGPGRPPAS